MLNLPPKPNGFGDAIAASKFVLDRATFRAQNRRAGVMRPSQSKLLAIFKTERKNGHFGACFTLSEAIHRYKTETLTSGRHGNTIVSSVTFYQWRSHMRKVEKRSFKFCEQCNRKFFYINPRQRYCSPRCRLAAFRKRKTLAGFGGYNDPSPWRIYTDLSPSESRDA